jgi:septal ring factor EnvC (AmiA/AmiB activator)
LDIRVVSFWWFCKELDDRSRKRNIRNSEFPTRAQFDDVQKAIEEGWCEIKINKKKRSREEIESEIAALKSRLSELEEELKNCE